MIVYLNGEFLPIEEAKVSVLDRGFIYGDGVYEVVPYTGASRSGCPAPHPAAAQPRRHPPRQSAHRSAMDVDHRRARCAPAVREPGRLLPGHARRREARPHVSEGRSRHGLHDEQSARDSVAEQIEQGVAVVTAEDNRWRRCDLKTISLVGNVLMRQLAPIPEPSRP
jgi:D-alanine transaminase